MAFQSGKNSVRNLLLEQAMERIEHQTPTAPAPYVALLRQCCREKALEPGKQLHQQIIKHRLDRDQFLINHVVQMYGKCGCVEEARSVFDSMHERNVFSWSIMISAYAQNGYPAQSLELYHEMERRKLRADRVTFVSVLSACSSSRNLREGKLLHDRIVSSRVELDAQLGTALMNMYGKCGCVSDAWSVFQSIPGKDAVAWNAMIAAYAQNGLSDEALELYREMKRGGLNPTEVTLTSVLDACADLADEQEGRRIHEFIVSSGIQLGGSLGNALVSLYGRCGRIEEARSVFESLQPRTVVSWTSIISAYAQNGLNSEALELYHRMNLKPNVVTFVAVLQACASLGDLLEGQRIHSRILSAGLQSDVSVGNSLVDMYGKCLGVEQAKQVFDGMKMKNVVSWNAMLTAFLQNSCFNEALKLSFRMDLEGTEFNSVTFIGVLGACSGSGDLDTGQRVHQRILHSGLGTDVILGTALLTMYGKCQRIQKAREVFIKLPEKNTISWNALMNAYVENGRYRAALELLDEMLAAGDLKPDRLTFLTALEACSLLGDLQAGRSTHEKIIHHGLESVTVVANTLITMYGKCGCLNEARGVLEKAPNKDVVSWNAMLAAYAQGEEYKEVMKLYRVMLLHGFRPDDATFLPVLEACSCSLGSSAGKIIHAHVQETGLQNDVVDSSLVNMYGKCGSLDLALLVFNTMKLKDSITWTTMIASYAQHGQSKRALGFFYSMQLEGVFTDGITLGCVFFAFGHSGNMKQAWEFFSSSIQDYGARPTFEHFLVMADMLSRAGRLEEAEELLSSMPYQPDLISWRSLLSACSSHGNVEIAERAADGIFELNPGDSAAFVLLSNIYSGAGMKDKAEKLKEKMMVVHQSPEALCTG